MKKINVLLLSILSIFLVSISLTSCYMSNPAPMEDVKGTYQLKSFTRSYEESNEDGSQTTTTTHDLIKEKSIIAYLVVNENGEGFYIYKDKENELSCSAIKVTYTFSLEDETLVSSLSYSDGTSSSGDGYPGKGRETLGVNFKTFGKNLEYSYPKVFNRKYSQKVTYEKKSSDTDLKYVNKTLSVNLTYHSYELNGLGGTYYSEWMGGHFEYLVLDINKKTLKGSVYYKLPNGEAQELKNKDLVTSSSKDEFGTETTSITIGSFTFKRTTGTALSSYLSYEYDGDLILLYQSDDTVEDAINHLLSLQNN